MPRERLLRCAGRFKVSTATAPSPLRRTKGSFACRAADMRRRPPLVRRTMARRPRQAPPRRRQAGVNMVAGGESSLVGLNTTRTFCPIFSASRSQSTMLVKTRTPSSSST